MSTSFENIWQYFEFFCLGENKELIGGNKRYQIFLDKDTDFYHFIKDGKEDFNLFWKYNGEEGPVCLDGKRRKVNKSIPGKSKKFYVKPLGMAIFLSATLLCAMNDYYQVVDLSLPLNKEDVKRSIFASKNIDSDLVKTFLWNEELIDIVLPYYDNLIVNLESRLRHHNIDIVPFSDKDMIERASDAGYYSLNNKLHVKDYVEDSLSDDYITTIAHEYVHLLQSNYDYPFIYESSASIIAKEFYFDDGGLEYSYRESSKYLKILMEIIGPEVILKVNFGSDNDVLRKALEPFLTNEDINEFLNIMKIHPSLIKEELEKHYLELEELLAKLYKNKYGVDMKNDELIQAILCDSTLNRFYFNERMMDLNCDYFMSYTVDGEEAFNRGLVSFYKKEEVSKKMFFWAVERWYAGRIEVKNGDYKKAILLDDIDNYPEEMLSFYLLVPIDASEYRKRQLRGTDDCLQHGPLFYDWQNDTVVLESGELENIPSIKDKFGYQKDELKLSRTGK